MNVTAEKKDQQVVLEVTVPAEDLAKAYDKAAKKVAQKVNIPGFRKGKAPLKVLERAVGKDYILQEAGEAIISETLPKALEEQNIDIVARPEIEDMKLELGQDVVYKAAVTPKPEVELGEYKGIQIEKFSTEVSDEDVQQQLVSMLDRQADMVEAEEGAAVENGNFITLDFKGTVDGVAFQGGESKDYPLEVGSNSFIPGFEEQLVGMKVGEEKDVNVTFPEEYHSEELKGKAAVFACKVNSIKKKVLPALDDEFAKKASTFQTLDELKADLRQKLEKSAASRAESNKREAALAKVCENAKVDIPAVMIENRVESMIQQMALNLESQGMKLEQYLQYAGMDITKLRENYKASAENNVKLDLVLEAVAKAEGVKVEAEDLDKEIEAMAVSYGATPAQVKKIIAEQGRLLDLTNTVLRRKTAQMLVEAAVEV
ncbi:MAG: trigger factor [Selenomonadaceae bacterium]|nr:trigger factor [Selenomonadaceae bacterium]